MRKTKTRRNQQQVYRHPFRELTPGRYLCHWPPSSMRTPQFLDAVREQGQGFLVYKWVGGTMHYALECLSIECTLTPAPQETEPIWLGPPIQDRSLRQALVAIQQSLDFCSAAKAIEIARDPRYMCDYMQAYLRQPSCAIKGFEKILKAVRDIDSAGRQELLLAEVKERMS